MIEKLTFGLFSKEDSHNFMRLMEYVRLSTKGIHEPMERMVFLTIRSD